MIRMKSVLLAALLAPLSAFANDLGAEIFTIEEGPDGPGTNAIDPGTSGPVVFQNFHSGRCMHVQGSSSSAGAPVEQNGEVERCNTGDHAFVWTPEPFIDRVTHKQIGSLLRNFHSNKCLQMLNGRADQAVCSTGDHAQAWTFNILIDSHGNLIGQTIQNFHTGKCVHVVGSSSAAGARLDEAACSGFNADHALIWSAFEVDL